MKKILIGAMALGIFLVSTPAIARALTNPVLSVGTVTDTSVQLRWTDAGNETSYQVWRSDDGVTFTRITSPTKNTLTYTNTGRTACTTYKYFVRALRTGSTSKDSNTVSVTTTGCTPSPSPTPTPTPTPPPPSCTGLDVPAGASLTSGTYDISEGVARTYCLSAGTYAMGGTPLSFDSGDVIIGQPVTKGPVLAPGVTTITAPTKITGTSTTQGVIYASAGDTTLTLENLDISGALRGVHGNNSTLVNLTVRTSRFHDSTQSGIGGVGQGLRVYDSEFDHNGNFGGGTDSGIKTVHYAEVRNTYIHHNDMMGMWWDCDAPGGLIENSRITDNYRDGVIVEISSGDASPRPLPAWGSYGFRVLRNHVERNNTGGTTPHGGLYSTSSQDVIFDGNTAINNTGWNIRVQNDNRSTINQHLGCDSGFPTQNVMVSNNQYGPQGISDTGLAGTTWTNNTQILP